MAYKEPHIISPGDGSDALTMASVASAALGMCLAANGVPYLAFLTLVVCGILDSFDGRFASRHDRTPTSRAYGAELDSISDAMAFGCQPVVLLLALDSSGAFALANGVVCALYLLCVARRLAWFGALDRTGTSDGNFVGLPVTYAALVLPMVAAATKLAGLAALLPLTLGLTMLVLACAYVTNVPVKRPGVKVILVLAAVAAVCAVYVALPLGA